MYYSRHKAPSAFDLAEMEAKAIRVLATRPRLPDCEAVADQMIKGLNFNIKVKAFFYALFWLFIVPTVPAGLASLISLMCGCDNFIATLWFGIVFATLFIGKGVAGNVQKRLYVAYCLGFRSCKSALSMGWDGFVYAPNIYPDDYFTQRYRLKMWRDR